MKCCRITYDKHGHIDPFTYIESIYKEDSQNDWEVDYETIPNIHLQEWRFADEYWKIFKGLKKGDSISLGIKIFSSPNDDEKIDLLIHWVFGYIKFICEKTNNDYEITLDNCLARIIFKDPSI
jgi:hypothetical protein